MSAFARKYHFCLNKVGFVFEGTYNGQFAIIISQSETPKGSNSIAGLTQKFIFMLTSLYDFIFLSCNHGCQLFYFRGRCKLTAIKLGKQT